MTTERIDIIVAERGSRVVSRNIKEIGTSASNSGRKVGFFKSELKKLVLVGGSVAASLFAMAKSATRFQDALAEVSTLVDTTVFDMNRLTKASLEQAALFGTGPAQQAKAFYQVISAGASTAAQAQNILTAANKLAVGGVTDIGTSVDGLTSVLNAYGDKVEGATAVSDAMFVAMKAGKTTIGELSASLGKVAPIAASAGVEFDELLASVSALTKGGISTRESVTGVRAILASVVKPAKEASEVASALGLDFSAAGLEAKGFAGFLEEVVTKTGGSTEIIAKLFGGVEALVPVLALSGQAGEDFNAILEDMKSKGGATEEAFNKIANSPGFQAKRVYGALAAEAAQLGSILLKVLVPAMRFLADNLNIIVGALKVAAAATLSYHAANVVTTGFIKLQAIPSLLLLEKSLGAATTRQAIMGVVAKSTLGKGLGIATTGVRALTVALLANPIGAIVAAITAAGTALFLFGDKIKVTEDGVVSLLDIFRALFSYVLAAVKPVADFFSDTWQVATGKVMSGFEGIRGDFINIFSAILSLTKTIVNAKISLWVGAYKTIAAAWKSFPKAIGDVVVTAVNFTIAQVEGMINKVTDGLNVLISGAEAVGKFFTPEKFEKDFGRLGDVSLGRISNRFEGEAKAVANIARDEFKAAFDTDYLGDAAAGLLKRAREIAENRAGELAADPVALPITPPTPTDVTIPKKDDSAKRITFQEILSDLQTEQELLQLSSKERERRIELLNIEDAIGRQLTASEAAQADQALVRIQQLRLEAQLREEVVEQQLFEMEALTTKRDILNQSLDQGAISLANYTNQMQDLNIKTLELKISMGDGSFADGFLLSLAKMTKGAQNWRSSVGTIFGDFFESFSDGFANSVGRAIVYSEDLGSALKDVAKQALSQLIGALVKLGIQALLNATLGSAIQSASTAASVAQGAAVTAAWTPAAIAVSLASFGANAIPAAAGAALVAASVKASQVASAIPGFMEGGFTGNGGRSEVAGLVHGQEFVFDAAATRRLGVDNLEKLRSSPRGSIQAPTGSGVNSASASLGGVNVEVNLEVNVDNKSGAQTPEEIGEAIGVQAKRQIVDIVNNELAKQSKNGGLLKSRSI